MVQRLADKHNVGPAVHKLLNLPHTTCFKAWLQFVLEVFLTQEVKPITGDPAKNRMHHSRSKLAICGIKKRTEEGHQEDEATSPKTIRERLGIPGKERHGPDDRQVEQAAFYAPVNSWSRTGAVIGQVQDCVLPCKSCICELDEASIVNNSQNRTKWKTLHLAFSSIKTQVSLSYAGRLAPDNQGDSAAERHRGANRYKPSAKASSNGTEKADDVRAKVSAKVSY